MIGLTKIGPNIRMAAIMDYILDITVRKTPVVILEKKNNSTRERGTYVRSHWILEL